MASDIQHDLGEALAKDLGEEVVYQHTDGSQDDAVCALVERASAEFGRLDCLFDNAGIAGVSGPIEEFDARMGVLLRGV